MTRIGKARAGCRVPYGAWAPALAGTRHARQVAHRAARRHSDEHVRAVDAMRWADPVGDCDGFANELPDQEDRLHAARVWFLAFGTPPPTLGHPMPSAGSGCLGEPCRQVLLRRLHGALLHEAYPGRGAERARQVEAKALRLLRRELAEWVPDRRRGWLPWPEGRWEPR